MNDAVMKQALAMQLSTLNMCVCVCVSFYGDKYTCIQGLWNFQSKTLGAPNGIAGNGETASKEGNAVKGHHQKHRGATSPIKADLAGCSQTSPWWSVADFLRRHRTNNGYTCSSMVMHDQKVRRLIQIFAPKLLLNSRLTKLFEAHHFGHYSAECLCTTEAARIWSSSSQFSTPSDRCVWAHGRMLCSPPPSFGKMFLQGWGGDPW